MTLCDKRVIVTGANGFVGTHLCKVLHAHGAKVIGVSRATIESNYVSDNYKVDLCDEYAVGRLIDLRQPDFVVHLAANRSRGRESSAWSDGYKQNVLGSFNLISACRKLSNFGRFVFFGSAAEYGNSPVPFCESNKETPTDAYGAGKLAVTEILRVLSKSDRFPSVILRPTIIYGPGQDVGMFLPALISSLIAGEKFSMSFGKQSRDLVYIDDLVSATILALTSPSLYGEVVNISSGEPIQIDLLAKFAASIVDNRSVELLDFGALEYRVGEAMEYWACNTVAERLLNWKPKVSLMEGLKRTIDYYKQKNIERL
jgi:UDP-glucose 4-epimerase